MHGTTIQKEQSIATVFGLKRFSPSHQSLFRSQF